MCVDIMYNAIRQTFNSKEVQVVLNEFNHIKDGKTEKNCKLVCQQLR